MTKALVLSGGGPVGVAWETGIVAGLASKGIDLGTADLILGTSAGSFVGAQLALGRDPSQLLERYRAMRPAGLHDEESASASIPAKPGQYGSSGQMQRFIQAATEAAGESRTPEQLRVAIGRAALEADTIPESEFLRRFREFDGERWPSRYACTAVDAETGQFVVWNSEHAIELRRAVASSCAAPGSSPPITINGRRYIDGGVRSSASADVATGHDVVLIVTVRDPDAPTHGNALLERARQRIVDERTAIRNAGGRVVLIAPDAASAAAMGTNPRATSVLPVAAEAGYRQGRTGAMHVSEFWT